MNVEVGYVIQRLSGRGYFLSHFYNVGKAEYPDGTYCPRVTQHTIFACGKCQPDLRTLTFEIGQFDPDSLVKSFLRGLESWKRDMYRPKLPTHPMLHPMC